MSFEELTPAKQLQVLKRRIGGYCTAFNTKVSGGTALAKQAIGPPAMHSDTVAQQLPQCMAELDEPFNKLTATLQDIIKIMLDEFLKSPKEATCSNNTNICCNF